MWSISELELELEPTNQDKIKMDHTVFLILLIIISLLIQDVGSDETFSVSEDDVNVNDPYPAWRLMWNLLGINLFLLSMVYTVISVVEKFYLEKRGFYEFEMEDWRMD